MTLSHVVRVHLLASLNNKFKDRDSSTVVNVKWIEFYYLCWGEKLLVLTNLFLIAIWEQFINSKINLRAKQISFMLICTSVYEIRYLRSCATNVRFINFLFYIKYSRWISALPFPKLKIIPSSTYASLYKKKLKVGT